MKVYKKKKNSKVIGKFTLPICRKKKNNFNNYDILQHVLDDGMELEEFIVGLTVVETT